MTTVCNDWSGSAGSEATGQADQPVAGGPQSLGCVELPLAAAAQAWPYLTYGSLVTVSR